MVKICKKFKFCLSQLYSYEIAIHLLIQNNATIHQSVITRGSNKPIVVLYVVVSIE